MSIRGMIDTGLTLSAMDIFRAVRRRIVPCLGLALMAGLITFLLFRGTPPVYTASTVLWFDERESRLVSADSAFSALQDQNKVTWVNEVAPIVKQAAIIESLPVMQRVIDELDLVEHQDVLTTSRGMAKRTLRERIGGLIPMGGGSEPAAEPELPSNEITADALPVGDNTVARNIEVAKRMSSVVEVVSNELTSIIAISVTSPDPRYASAIANSLPQAYLAEQNARLSAASSGVIDWLENQTQEIRDRIQEGSQPSQGSVVLQQIIRDADVDLYRDMLQRMNQMQQITDLNTRPISVITPAPVPKEPSGSIVTSLAAGAAFGVFVLSVLVLVVIELANNTIRYPSQLTGMGLNVLSATPRLASEPKVTEGVPQTEHRFAEAIRRLLSSALSPQARRPITLAFTSGVKHEGKSLIAREFARAAARSGIRTILVEADLRHPNSLGLYPEAGRGLIGVLEGEMALKDAIVEIPVRLGVPLSVLPATEVAPDSLEALASSNMQRLMGALREDYEFIVIDTSPIGMTADAEVLAPLVDGVVLVLDYGRATQARTRFVVEAIDRDGGNLVGCVVNRAPNDFFNSLYGYGDHDYGYGVSNMTETAEGAERPKPKKPEIAAAVKPAKPPSIRSATNGSDKITRISGRSDVG